MMPRLELSRLQRDRAGQAGGDRWPCARALEPPGNPSSVHRFGREARRALEHARAAVAAMVGARPAQVVFTSGGTEANNQALRSVARPDRGFGDRARFGARGGAGAARIAVDAEGRDRFASARARAGAPPPALVSVMLANNETGVIQPVREVVEVRPAPRRARPLRRGPGGRQAGDRHRARSASISSRSRRTSSAVRRASARWWWATGSSPRPCCAAAARSAAGDPAPRTCRASWASGARASWPWRTRTGGARTGALRDRLEAGIAALAPAARVFGRGRRAAAQHALPHHARGQQPDPADRRSTSPASRSAPARPARRARSARPTCWPRWASSRRRRRARSGSAWAGPAPPTTSIASSPPGDGCTSAPGGDGRRAVPAGLAARLLLPPAHDINEARFARGTTRPWPTRCCR